MIMNDRLVTEELCADSYSSSHWVPPSVRSKIEVYRNQPRSIVDYEPGFSSIAIREAKTVSAHPPSLPSPRCPWTSFLPLGDLSRLRSGRVAMTPVLPFNHVIS